MSREKTTAQDQTPRRQTAQGPSARGHAAGDRPAPAAAQPGAVTASPRPATRRSLAVAGAVGSAVVLWLAGFGLLGLDPEVGSAGQVQEVNLASTVAVPLLAGLAAWGLLALLERRGAKGVRAWRIIGTVFLAVSLLGPLGLGTGAGTLVVLLLMHLSVGAVLLLGLPVPRKHAAAYSVKNRGGELS